jgi:hypothetical protein
MPTDTLNQPQGMCCGTPTKSVGPVRYFNGELDLVVRDLVTSGYGLPWGHARIYSNRMSSDCDYGNAATTGWCRSAAYIERVGATTLVVAQSRPPSGSIWSIASGRRGTERFTLVQDTGAASTR